jgi:hypothetical protein
MLCIHLYKFDSTSHHIQHDDECWERFVWTLKHYDVKKRETSLKFKSAQVNKCEPKIKGQQTLKQSSNSQMLPPYHAHSNLSDSSYTSSVQTQV